MKGCLIARGCEMIQTQEFIEKFVSCVLLQSSTFICLVSTKIAWVGMDTTHYNADLHHP